MNTIVVVDDEIKALDSLVNFIEEHIDNLKVIGKFREAKSALSFIVQNNPDIVITDIKMPGMSGIELIDRLRMANIDSKIVILSGYSDFKYAQEAIRYQVSEYVLKPVNIVELKKILNRIQSELREEKSDSIIDMQQEQIMVDLCLGAYSSEETFYKDFERLNFAFGKDKIKGCIVEVTIRNFDDFMKNIWTYEYEVLSKILLNILRMSHKHRWPYLISCNKGVFNFVKIGQLAEGESKEDSEILSELLMTECEVKVIYSFSDVSQLLNGDLTEHFGKETLALLFSYKRIGEQEKEKNIYNRLTKNNESPALISELINRLEKDFRSVSGNDNALIRNIEKYIMDNVTRDLSRSDIADYVHLNETYVGRLFKQATGKSIHEYHLELRMKKAIQMLENEEKIGYISVVLGYEDNRKFIRNFKSFTGYTPSEYKKIILLDVD